MRATAAETRHSLIFRLEEASDPNLTSGYRDILQAWMRSRSLEQEMRGRIQRLLEQVGFRFLCEASRGTQEAIPQVDKLQT